MTDPYSPQAQKIHDEVMANWKAYKAGTITFDEMKMKNDRICLKSELKVEKVRELPKSVQSAANIMGGNVVERGCPDDPDGPGWNW